MGKNNKTIFLIKFFAIFSVVCAHCNKVDTDYSAFSTIASIAMSVVGTWGVVAFFGVSGFLFNPENKFLPFFKKRLFSLVLPWIISGTAVFLYVYLRRSSFSASDYVNFIAGNGSYLYYLSVLFIFHLLYFAIPFFRNIFFQLALVIGSVINIVFFSDCLTLNGIISPYLNPLNWLCYFATGNIVRQLEIKISKNFALIASICSFLICASLIAISCLKQIPGSYFGPLGFCAAVFGGFLIVFDSVLLADYSLSFIEYLGKHSFFIYLWHMPFAGIVANLLSKKWLNYFVLLRPFLVLLLFFCIIKVLDILVSKTKKLKFCETVLMLVGIRF